MISTSVVKLALFCTVLVVSTTVFAAPTTKSAQAATGAPASLKEGENLVPTDRQFFSRKDLEKFSKELGKLQEKFGIPIMLNLPAGQQPFFGFLTQPPTGIVVNF